MKFTSVLRKQAVLVGLGALFFANAAYAQQEVDPTTFEPSPGMIQEQGVSVAQASTPDAVSAAPVAASPLAVTDTESMASQEAGAKEWTPVDTLALMGTIFLLAFIVTRGIAEVVRERQSQIPA